MKNCKCEKCSTCRMRRLRIRRKLVIKKVDPHEGNFVEGFRASFDIGNMFDVIRFHYPDSLIEDDKRVLQLKKDREEVELEISKQNLMNPHNRMVF